MISVKCCWNDGEGHGRSQHWVRQRGVTRDPKESRFFERMLSEGRSSGEGKTEEAS